MARHWPWVVAPVLLLAGGLWLLASDDAGEVPDDGVETAHVTATAAPAGLPSEGGVAEDAVAARAASAPMAWPALPPVEAPFAEVVDELRRRATAGDPKAACRLAAEIAACAQAREQIIALEARLRWQRDNPEAAARQRQRDGNQGDQLLQRGERLLAEEARCEGSAGYSPAEKYQWLRQAALAGHLPAMGEYASGNVFRSRDTLDSLAALATYRNEAETMARRVADSGDAGMVLALARAYSPAQGDRYPNLLQQAVEPDAVESLARYLQALALLPAPGDRRSERSLRQIEQQIALLQELATPAQRNEADSLARRRAAEWKPAVAGELGHAGISLGRRPSLQPGQCDLDLYAR